LHGRTPIVLVVSYLNFMVARGMESVNKVIKQRVERRSRGAASHSGGDQEEPLKSVAKKLKVIAITPKPLDEAGFVGSPCLFANY
jgi:hypothetical protein